ncbi:MAG: hypothetical protein RLZZ244_246, partial [Verrucomicrobiota bacterium]
MIRPLVLIFVLVLIWSAPSKAATDPNPLLRLKYQNPGLRVDLGVGLWAEPLPMDFDGDGFLDLVVNCPDVPFNGAYFFRNPGMDTTLHPSPVFQPGKRISAGHFNAAVSYGENEVTVMTPGKKYPHFTQDGFSKGVSLGLPANIHPRRVR